MRPLSRVPNRSYPAGAAGRTMLVATMPGAGSVSTLGCFRVG